MIITQDANQLTPKVICEIYCEEMWLLGTFSCVQCTLVYSLIIKKRTSNTRQQRTLYDRTAFTMRTHETAMNHTITIQKSHHNLITFI